MTQPDNVEYARPLPPPHRPEGSIRDLFVGMAIGIAISGATWFWAFHRIDQYLWMILAVPVLKIVAGIVLIAAFRQLRFLGIGLLLSIPLVALLFVVTCFGVLIIHG